MIIYGTFLISLNNKKYIKYLFFYLKNYNYYFIFKNIDLIGDWGLGIGDWGLGIGTNPQ